MHAALAIRTRASRVNLPSRPYSSIKKLLRTKLLKRTFSRILFSISGARNNLYLLFFIILFLRGVQK